MACNAFIFEMEKGDGEARLYVTVRRGNSATTKL
jgi:hypothetical protein